MSAQQPAPAETTPWNVPNALTTFRLVLVPVFAWMLLAHPTGTGWQLATAAVFTIAILADYAQSFGPIMARKHDIVTKFGKLADPIADKALTGMAFIGLSINGELWWWVTILILIREWGITLLRFAILKYGVMAANRGGKLKTVTQAVAVILYLLPLPGWAQPVAWVVMGLAFLLTMVTGIDYLWQAWKLRRDALRGHAG